MSTVSRAKNGSGKPSHFSAQRTRREALRKNKETHAPKAFDPEKLIAEIETLVVNQGVHKNKNFVVLPWQRKLIRLLSVFSEVALTIARSNGKTTLCAAVAVSAITPGKSLFVERGEVVLTASSMNQARIAFKHIKQFMRPVTHIKNQRGELVLNRKEWKLIDNSHHVEMLHIPTETSLRCIGADPSRAHGLAPHLVIADEPAQWVRQPSRHYAALRTSLGKQVNPRFLIIGTRPRSPLHFFSKLLFSPPPTVASIVYAVDKKFAKKHGLFSMRCIRKANPSYDHLPSLRKELHDFRDDAKVSRLRLNDYKALYLNMGTTEGDEIEDVVDEQNWEVVTEFPEAEREGKVAIGFDLGGGNSLSAISFYWPLTGRLEAYGCLPADPPLDERGENDGIGETYQEMLEAGLLFIHGQKETRNSDFLIERLETIQDFEWLGIAGDKFKETAIKQAMYEAKIDEKLLVDRRVGKGPSGNEDLEGFRAEVLSEHIRPGFNLALEHALASAVVRRDTNGNSALDKSHQKGRIDVLQAVIHAVGLGYRWRKPPESRLQDFYDHAMTTGMELVEGI